MKKIILSTLALLIVAVATPLIVSDVGFAQIDQGVKATCPNGVCPTGTVDGLVEDIINIFSWIIGVVSVIMILFGGFKYITSGGDSGKVSSAKNTILYAIVGLVIAALAQVIVQFVLGNVT